MPTAVDLMKMAESHALYARRCLNERHIEGWGNVAQAEAATATALCALATLKLTLEE